METEIPLHSHKLTITALRPRYIIVNIRPTIPPNKINQAELILYLNTKNIEIIASIIVGTSNKAAAPSFKVTTVIKPRDATFTPSKTPETQLEPLSFGITLFNKPTNTNAGKKIPMVATTAPGIPFIK